MELRALSPQWLEKMGPTDPLLIARRMSGPGYVVLHDGEPIAAGGLGRVCAREYVAWAVITPQARASKLLMRKLTREARRLYPLVRDLVQAEYVSADVIDHPDFCGWLEMLGLRKIHMVRYAWVRRVADVGV